MKLALLCKKIILDLPLSATNHFLGIQSLCIGMPVIIRNNDATELCIMKGQEGHVVGWQAGRGIHGQLVLNTLFIQLDKPVKGVKIDGLPKSVVPITKGSKNVECIFSSNLKEYIYRSQVWVLHKERLD
jgi:hypothetical protein